MDHFLEPICILSELYLNFRLKTPMKTGPLSGSPTGWLTLFNYCDGAMVAVGYLETLLKVEGWWEKMSSRPRPAAVAGDVLCCLVLSFLDYEGSLLLMINFTQLSLVPPTHWLLLSCHTQSFLASKPKIIVTETWCQSSRGFNFILE